jgi:hypothetical protein
MISAYTDDIVIKVKRRGNLNREIKMVETEFGKMNLKTKQKNAVSCES